jgi:hypothetical protein
MSIFSPNGPISTNVLGNLEEVCRESARGIVRDPELLRRVYERSGKARKETLWQLGVQDIDVPIIREIRDSE